MDTARLKGRVVAGGRGEFVQQHVSFELAGGVVEEIDAEASSHARVVGGLGAGEDAHTGGLSVIHGGVEVDRAC